MVAFCHSWIFSHFHINVPQSLSQTHLCWWPRKPLVTRSTCKISVALSTEHRLKCNHIFECLIRRAIFTATQSVCLCFYVRFCCSSKLSLPPACTRTQTVRSFFWTGERVHRRWETEMVRQGVMGLLLQGLLENNEVLKWTKYLPWETCNDNLRQ